MESLIVKQKPASNDVCSVPENICIPATEVEKVDAKNHKYDAHNYLESQKYAITGLFLILKNERNFRIQLIASILVVILGLFLHISHADWVALFIVIALVLIAEAFNSVIEAVCDTISQDYRINIQYAKDVSAGAVFVSACVSIIAGVIIFVPYITTFIKTTLSL